MNSNEITNHTQNHNLYDFTENNSKSNIRHSSSSKVKFNIILG